MDGSKRHAMTPGDLDHGLAEELTEALHVSPSAEFRARIRTRLDAEEMRAAWHPRVPVVVFAGIASLLVAGGVWLMPGSHPVATTPVASTPSPHVAQLLHPAVAGATKVSLPAPIPQKSTKPIRQTAQVPPVAEAPVPRAAEPEVLLSESERAGVRLLFESAASGRLRLPEEMLQDPTPPIVEARTSVPFLDQPSSDRWKE